MKTLNSIFFVCYVLLAPIAVCAVPSEFRPVPVREGAYFGVNYTAPFAHAYRALKSEGVDIHKAIDKDVSQMARLGLNAFRLHLWDVELSDASGNLLETGNEHLELLDYLLYKLAQNNIAIIITAQTNFGNGYPERNTDPNGAFSYRYDKCDVHFNPLAQQAQENYLQDLVKHVNSYTGLNYANDPAIIAIEINNEPCHTASASEITAYINRMVKALKNAGWEKEILYNVSHNLENTQALYDAEIDGGTFQWYPTGLVHGSQRKGNFLPMLDSYDIPFDSIKGYKERSKVIYEFDPADVLDTYLYPAAVRSFRKAGFTWATQFAYDPTDIARHNTEYQTHFLNLMYTPGKAIGMMIATEAMRQIPVGTDYGKYPNDTIFGPFTVSARRNLATLNDGDHFYHTNSTDMLPKDIIRLKIIAGVGNSPILKTDGTGAYFLDRINKTEWSLEVMPDVVITSDPFAKPSPRRDVAVLTETPITMALNSELLGLGSEFYYKSVDGNISGSTEGSMTIPAGKYILSAAKPSKKAASGNIRKNNDGSSTIGADSIETILIEFGPVTEDVKELVVYPSHVNFWNEKNELFQMQKDGKYNYKVKIDKSTAQRLKDRGTNDFTYRVVVFNRDGSASTYPGGYEGTPLDWDFRDNTELYSIHLYENGDPVELIRPEASMNFTEYTTVPECWRGVAYYYSSPLGEAPRFVLEVDKDAATDMAVVSKYVANEINIAQPKDYDALHVKLASENPIKVGLVNSDGFTYTTTILPADDDPHSYVIPLDVFELDATVLSPAPYPIFLKRLFVPDADTATPLQPNRIETITINAREGKSEIYGAELIKSNKN